MPAGRRQEGRVGFGRKSVKDDKRSLTPAADKTAPKAAEDVKEWFERTVEDEDLKQFARDNPSIFPFAVQRAKKYGRSEKEINDLIVQAITAEYSARRVQKKHRRIVAACQSYHRTP